MATTRGLPKGAPENPGAQAWHLFWELFKANKPYMDELAGEFELTPQQAWALKLLAVEKPLAMSELADALACDASNVTAIVDRLEARGLVERRSAGHDRRVKALIVTRAGLALYQRLWTRMQHPPPSIASLPIADQRALRDLLRRALDSIEPAHAGEAKEA